ncbi:MAG: hypothetical protein PT944_00390 [Actinomycetaceae bacterium]|nr:hypothetical protein [Arcanobacterium sp.]MDD7686364.1 hypothetical protein [Actinomycetaceae bacterium]MDY5274223.1 hypothetical protein [Arcanobacterium sp.]
MSQKISMLRFSAAEFNRIDVIDKPNPQISPTSSDPRSVLAGGFQWRTALCVTASTASLHAVQHGVTALTLFEIAHYSEAVPWRCFGGALGVRWVML